MNSLLVSVLLKLLQSGGARKIWRNDAKVPGSWKEHSLRVLACGLERRRHTLHMRLGLVPECWRFDPVGPGEPDPDHFVLKPEMRRSTHELSLGVEPKQSRIPSCRALFLLGRGREEEFQEVQEA